MILDDVRDLILSGFRSTEPQGDRPVLWMNNVTAVTISAWPATAKKSAASDQFPARRGRHARPLARSLDAGAHQRLDAFDSRHAILQKRRGVFEFT
jgi:hypothetical protein